MLKTEKVGHVGKHKVAHVVKSAKAARVTTAVPLSDSVNGRHISQDPE